MTVLIPARRSRLKVVAVKDGFAATPQSSGRLVGAAAAALVARVAATATARSERASSAKRRR
jgi:hypothetical protein